VGIATTKTLSKIATEIAKKNPRHQDVLSLIQSTEEELDEVLASIVLKDVWGIGSRYAHRLQASRSIFTAKDLKDADEHWIRKRFSVTVQRSVLELRGIACIPLETEPKPKKGIMTAKSFGRPVESLAELEEAVATYTARAVEKLRSQGSAASCISVFITTNPFQQDAPPYANSLSRLLPFQSAFTPDFLNVALDMVRSLYQPGFAYKKAGVFLSKIVSQEVLQADLFGDYSLERQYTQARLMAIIDFINQWWGLNTIFFGAQGIGREWKMRQERRSPRFTTQWGEILVVST
jgi:DNA polymerase V